MRKKINGLVLSIILATGSLVADDTFDTSSLIGGEGGYSSLDVERSDTTGVNLKKKNLPHAGLKVGAQTRDWRVFLGVNYYSGSDFDYMTTYGISVQYLINISKVANVFLGVNAGLSNIKYSVSGESKSRTLSDSYYGGDVGMNMHLSKSIDLEVGARYISPDASNTISGVTYTFDNMITGYGSIIYKFQMD